MIIVIDGPAGAGKSSTAKAVAQKLGIEYLDSGALYRVLTLVYLKSDKNSDVFFKMLKKQDISFEYADEVFKVSLNGSDVTHQLRMPDVANNVSNVASMPESREYINRLMRNAVANGAYIAEGRDLGTAVFPDADLKFYMSADVNERARRRYDELISEGVQISIREVKQNILERDHKDSKRKAAPLRKADDAIEIDTTNLNFEQQVEQICYKVVNKLELPIKS